jgi:hypothetical protein
LRRYDGSMIARLLRFSSIFGLLALAACAGGSGSAELAQAKAECWMKFEGDKKIKNLDQRLSLVEKCVDDTLRGQLVQRPQR